MQFNPIFLSSNPETNISNGNNIKAFENAKYLFSDKLGFTASYSLRSAGDVSMILVGVDYTLGW